MTASQTVVEGDITTLKVDAIVNAANNSGPLRNCYRRCFELVEEHNARSVAIPAISTGVYAYPMGQAARVTVTESPRFLQNNESLVLVCFSGRAFQIYTAAVREALEHS